MATPNIDDHQIPPNEFEVKGNLSAIASRVVLKVLFTARLTRPDLLWTVNNLARNITKWTKAHDRRLHRLMCYIHHTVDWTQICYVGNNVTDINLVLFTDASFAGDLVDSKSTTGTLMCLIGSNTFVPLTWMYRKQGAISHSSSEAEVIAMDAGLRMNGIPALEFWDLVKDVMDPIDTRPVRSKTQTSRCHGQSGNKIKQGETTK